jgi:hypothetical protein
LGGGGEEEERGHFEVDFLPLGWAV